MPYFNYHAKIMKLIKEGKLVGYRFVDEYNGIKPALLLYFFDERRPIMPVRVHLFDDYLKILPKDKELKD
ncbi:MAG: thermostable hemolysin delta-VPH [Clostridia bacterium]|nr:thermostable hemolysin delta-VPH [Clostridia bacterium]